ncbi:Bis(5'-nucleosyl)-tetraphosphatase, symmetrical like [Actinidia chinensis var. chinensis]|uniref:Bis(5'-nucleosyl)-tetraphosphatase, symmetrical like n=1 Tax=Actinidia chinensis var. chinensis TaxID=1590841 RepID=A0A2R6QS39_ACTCC|nr:Bis(5'-nucleosyl)-tetraphosphatase, symmetrical like [Actinidia chinensis var. chinensis]
MATSVRIAVVGDVHDDWNLQEDTKALQLLRPDLVLFTGDFGNENLELVRSIADLKFAKAVILGNHDAWSTQQFSQRRKDRVQLQLECLGEEHVGYRRLDYPTLKLSIVGGRPFSCGGEQLFRKSLLAARYGIHDMDGSAKRIYEAALGAPEGHLVILLAHNGPTGLGSNLSDICGKDWVFGGGDHGDPDLARAISLLKETTKLSIPLVVFGHMHKELARRNGLRKMIVVGADNIVYLNGAIVPRVKRSADEQTTSNRSFTNNESSLSTPSTEATVRAFTLVEISDGKLEKIAEAWVSVIGEKTELKEEHILFSRGPGGTAISV